MLALTDVLSPAVRTICRLATEQLLERGQVADRVEVRVVSRDPAAVLPHLDRRTKVLNSVGSSTREALTTGDVVVEVWLVGTCLDQP